MKKMVVMINVYDERSKERVIRTVASCSGITTITMDSKEGKLMVIGEFDEIKILTKLKRRWQSVTFGPYGIKKEAETTPAVEKKKKEETKRQGLQFLSKSHRENPICPMHHHSSILYDHDHYHGCVIS